MVLLKFTKKRFKQKGKESHQKCLTAKPVSATSLDVYIDPLIMCRASSFRLPDIVLAIAGNHKFTPNSATANSAKLQEVFRNRKFASLRMVCGNFSHFRNRKCTLHFRNHKLQYLLLFCLLVMVFLFWRSNFAVDQTLTSEKEKGHQHPDVNLQPRK